MLKRLLAVIAVTLLGALTTLPPATAGGGGSVSAFDGGYAVSVNKSGSSGSSSPGGGTSRSGGGEGSGGGGAPTVYTVQGPTGAITSVGTPVFSCGSTNTFNPGGTSLGGTITNTNGCGGGGGGGGGAAAAPVITPADVAAMALSMLRPASPEIHTAIQPGGEAVVGAPFWMWTPASLWEAQTATASAGGFTVTAVAKVSRVTWSMGDGSTVTCAVPGTPYQRSFGLMDSPNCGHRYQLTSWGKPGNKYTITATAHYTITWSGAASGSDTTTRSSSTTMPVGEIQVLVTG